MRRRALLTTLGAAAVAGCQTTPTDPDRGTPTESPTPHEDDPIPAWASIVDLETIDRTYALGPARYRTDDGARIRLRFTATATADHPATVTATLENANEFANTFRLRWTPPFGRLASDRPHPPGDRHGGDTDAGLVFVPTANHDLVDESPELERDTNGLWRLTRGAVPQLPERIELDPRERVRGEYALVGRAEGDGVGRPTGVYEFSRAGERPVRVSVWRTSTPGPTPESRFAGAELPPVSEETTTGWFHEADAGTATFVRPSTERTELPARIAFTFVNRSRAEVGCGHWNLYKLVDDAWFHLGPYVHTADCRVVQPGGAQRWTMRVANGEMAPCEAQSYPFLGDGRYGIVSGYGENSHTGALLAIDAPPVTVEATDDLRVDRADGVVTATSDRWRTAPDAENRARVHLVLERTETADRRLIAEQLMRDRFRGLRNIVAFADPDADRVILRTDDRTADRAVGYDADASARFRYDDARYVVTRAAP